jgi:allophanate hydrolase subunit 2
LQWLSPSPLPALIVVAAGIRTTVQDRGRIGWQRLGEANLICGVADGSAMRLTA